jgi:hypothetical protein
VDAFGQSPWGRSWFAFFQFRFTNAGGISPADGIAFVLQTVNNNVGGAGGGLGYVGIANSVAVEFDTFNNGPAFGDPNGNHVAIDTGGNLNGSGVIVNGQSNCANTATVAGTPNCMANGDIWSVWIDYDGTTLQVALADNSTDRPRASSTRRSIFHPSGSTSAFIQATGATGADLSQDILNWQLVQRFAD